MMDQAFSGTRTVTAMFDSSAEAERAIARLRSAGVPDSAIRHTRGASSSYSGSVDATDTTYRDQHKGFWDSLGDFFFPEEDRYTYAEGLSRGSHMVTVTGFDAALHDTVVGILDDEGSIDLDTRESEWRSSGWSGYQGSEYYADRDDISGTGGMAGASSGLAGTAAGLGGGTLTGDSNTRGTIYDDGRQDRSVQMAADAGRDRFHSDLGPEASQQQGFAGAGSMSQAGGTAGGTAAGSSYTGGRELNEDGTVKVVEERLDVGKRDVAQGAVRVRSYVREEPVSKDVDLRATRVHVERRPVDRAVAPGEVPRDQVIEAREHAEEAVVGKEARVVEEIGLRSDTEVQHERVQDTVRKTEVEIEDSRTGTTSPLTGNKDRGGY